MLLVRDIMKRQVYAVEASASAEEAAWGLTRRHIGGAPTLDDKGNVVGMISKSDLVDPEPAQWIKGEATVGDLMSPDVRTIYAEDPAMAAVAEMAKSGVHRLVVLGADSKMVGIVTAMDIVLAMARGERFDLDA